jgi:hypothetical protein
MEGHGGAEVHGYPIKMASSSESDVLGLVEVRVVWVLRLSFDDVAEPSSEKKQAPLDVPEKL